MVPQEFDISNGDSAINILSELDDFDGLTIIIESVSVSGLLLKKSVAQNESIELMPKISGKYQRLITDQTEKISNYFKKNQHEYAGGYVYICGFCQLIPTADEDLLPEAEFFPWYLEVDNKSSLRRIVRQPELSLLMRKMKEVEPLIHNLDDYLAEMIKWESELDD